MEVERAGPIPRERGNMGPPAKKLKASKAKKTVSVAAIFKQQNSATQRGSITPQAHLNTPEFTVEDVDATTLLSVKSHSSVRSSSKTGRRVARKRSADIHPLGVAFRGSASNSHLIFSVLKMLHRYHRRLPPPPLQNHLFEDQQDPRNPPANPPRKHSADYTQ
jgi:hypothetical protein